MSEAPSSVHKAGTITILNYVKLIGTVFFGLGTVLLISFAEGSHMLEALLICRLCVCHWQVPPAAAAS
jgi:hypothetical protein